MGRPGKYGRREDTLEDRSLMKMKDAKCHWCQQGLSRRSIVHKNKFHDPEVLHFCSKTCHNAWCYSQNKE